MCKPHKMNGAGGLKLDVHKVGFGKIRDEVHAKVDLKTVHLHCAVRVERRVRG